MAASRNVSDLVRIQTLVNVLSNQAQWAYMTRPGQVNAIAKILADTAMQIGDLLPAKKVLCPTGYCQDQNACIPCDLPRRGRGKPLPGSWLDKGADAFK
jgi:hypothetical protein